MTLSNELKVSLQRDGLTVYGAAHLVACELDESTKVAHKRLQKWVVNPPLSLRRLEEDLALLGYEIKLKRIR